MCGPGAHLLGVPPAGRGAGAPPPGMSGETRDSRDTRHQTCFGVNHGQVCATQLCSPALKQFPWGGRAFHSKATSFCFVPHPTALAIPEDEETED